MKTEAPTPREVHDAVSTVHVLCDRLQSALNEREARCVREFARGRELGWKEVSEACQAKVCGLAAPLGPDAVAKHAAEVGRLAAEHLSPKNGVMTEEVRTLKAERDKARHEASAAKDAAAQNAVAYEQAQEENRRLSQDLVKALDEVKGLKEERGMYGVMIVNGEKITEKQRLERLVDSLLAELKELKSGRDELRVKLASASDLARRILGVPEGEGP
jgi:hypothetical protein